MLALAQTLTDRASQFFKTPRAAFSVALLMIAGSAMASTGKIANDNKPEQKAKTAVTKAVSAPEFMTIKIVDGKNAGKIVKWDFNQSDAIGKLQKKYGNSFEIVNDIPAVKASVKPKTDTQVKEKQVEAPKADTLKTETPVIDQQENNAVQVESGSLAQAMQALKTQSGEDTTKVKTEPTAQQTAPSTTTPKTADVNNNTTGVSPTVADTGKGTEAAPPPAVQETTDNTKITLDVDSDPLTLRGRSAGFGTGNNGIFAQQTGGQTPTTTGQTFDPNFRNNRINDWRVGVDFWNRGDFNLSGNIPSTYIYGKEGKATFFYQRLFPNQWVDVNRQYWMSYEMGNSQQPWTLTVGHFEQGKKDDKNTPGRGWAMNIASGERELLDGAKVGAGNGNGGYTTMAVGSPVRYDGSSRGLTWNFDTIQTHRYSNGYTGSTNFTMRANTENGLSVFSYNQLQVGKSTYFNFDGGINERGAGLQLNLDHRLQHGFGLGLNYENWSQNWNGGANALGAEVYWRGKWNMNNRMSATFGISYDTALWGNNAVMNRNGGRSGFVIQGSLQFKF